VFGQISGEPNTKSFIKSMVQPYLNMNDVVKPNIGLNGDLAMSLKCGEVPPAG
jgi:hypothetical protein